ncbi:MAG: helix-turn-helix domain-containing protein [Trebonia sp.]
MSFEDDMRPRLDVTDPKAMRALAHPVRMALLELFNVTPTLTATQASETLGESPANCAFHLRTLAKYGFIEEVGGGRGRERPWRLVHSGLSVSSSHQRDPQARIAAETLGSAMRDRWLERIRRTMAAGSWPDGWEQAVTASNNVRFLTPAEAAGAMEEMLEILNRYRDRTRDPALRPKGARPVDINIFSYPLAGPDGAALSESQDIS